MNDRDTQPWGPWALALGALAIGIVAVCIEGIRVLRRRLTRTD